MSKTFSREELKQIKRRAVETQVKLASIKGELGDALDLVQRIEVMASEVHTDEWGPEVWDEDGDATMLELIGVLGELTRATDKMFREAGE